MIRAVLEKISPSKIYTAEDYFNLPEGSPYQLIEGELVMTPSPITPHQAVSRNMEMAIYSHVKKHNLGFVYYAPIDVYLDESNAYQPDIIYISGKNKGIIKRKGIDGAPDLVIEILSPSTAYYDMNLKKDVYEKSGVLEYIIVDSNYKTIDVYLNNVFFDRSYDNNSMDSMQDKGNREENMRVKNIQGEENRNNLEKSGGCSAKFEKSSSLKETGILRIKTLNLEIDLKDIFTEM